MISFGSKYGQQLRVRGTDAHFAIIETSRFDDLNGRTSTSYHIDVAEIEQLIDELQQIKEDLSNE